jgi:hypothetical protein
MDSNLQLPELNQLDNRLQTTFYVQLLHDINNKMARFLKDENNTYCSVILLFSLMRLDKTNVVFNSIFKITNSDHKTSEFLLIVSTVQPHTNYQAHRHTYNSDYNPSPDYYSEYSLH